LRQIDQARGDLYAISDDLEFLKAQLARLPTRAYLRRTLLLAMAITWALLIAPMLLR
jgi:hypothetical protein